MTRNITLLSNNDIDGLQMGKSIGSFHFYRRLDTVFFCVFLLIFIII